MSCARRRGLKNTSIFVDTFDEESSETRNVVVSDKSRTEVDEHVEALCEKMNEPSSRSTRVRGERKWSSIHKVPRPFATEETSSK